MDTSKLKTEIGTIVNKVPEEILPHILIYLRTLENLTPHEVKTDAIIRKIMLEDRALLQRLADS
jgi:hypothetical protein